MSSHSSHHNLFVLLSEELEIRKVRIKLFILGVAMVGSERLRSDGVLTLSHYRSSQSLSLSESSTSTLPLHLSPYFAIIY